MGTNWVAFFDGNCLIQFYVFLNERKKKKEKEDVQLLIWSPQKINKTNVLT